MAGVREVFEIVDRATRPLRNIGNEMQSVNNSATSLRGTVTGLVAGFATLATVRKAIALSDELALTQARLNNVNDGLQTNAELQEMIYQAGGEFADKFELKGLKLIENPSKMLSAILIGNNIVNLSASSLATTLAVKIFGSVGAGIATGILTFLILIFGEVSPKTLATIHADKISLKISGIIEFLMFIFTPLILVINTFSMGFLMGCQERSVLFPAELSEVSLLPSIERNSTW